MPNRIKSQIDCPRDASGKVDMYGTPSSMRVQTGWMLGISLARRGCMLMGLSICATLGGTISYGYGSPPTTISSCRYRLAYHHDIQIRALYGGYDPIGSRYQVSLLFVGCLSTRLRSAADAILLLFRLRPISLRKRAFPHSNEFPPSSLCFYFFSERNSLIVTFDGTIPSSYFGEFDRDGRWDARNLEM